MLHKKTTLSFYHRLIQPVFWPQLVCFKARQPFTDSDTRNQTHHWQHLMTIQRCLQGAQTSQVHCGSAIIFLPMDLGICSCSSHVRYSSTGWFRQNQEPCLTHLSQKGNNRRQQRPLGYCSPGKHSVLVPTLPRWTIRNVIWGITNLLILPPCR